MSKELTEQWRNGTLEDGAYYILVDKYEQNEPEIDVGICYNSNFEWWIVKEVLAPVPDYDQFVELTKKVHILNEAAMNMENAIASNADYFRQKISVLESRINKAVALIKDGRFVEALQLLEE